MESKELSEKLKLKIPFHVKSKLKHGRGFKFLINNFPCTKENCPNFPHYNKICGHRAEYYVRYIKKGADTTIPMLMDELIMKQHMRMEEEEKCRNGKDGSMSPQWFLYDKAILSILQEIGRKEEHLSEKAEVRQTHLGEIRKKIMEIKKDIKGENIILTIEKEIKREDEHNNKRRIQRENNDVREEVQSSS